ncbi:hypothetical protein C2845_PM15G25910 [Panicum miliaceum]|uniref:Uncharacterized protein n=1 Tax=Panicum miliaceum TaxID=4540 RepID=A0A3L6Q8E3_PANMI|nr:hypothetical protein C2845_PM15G25910 [Panicum miliaceum]
MSRSAAGLKIERLWLWHAPTRSDQEAPGIPLCQEAQRFRLTDVEGYPAWHWEDVMQGCVRPSRMLRSF